jgi:glycosyltransferase involved in cell wall biosynthesis
VTRPLRIVAHEATRTGAPAVLRSLLRFARPHIDVPFDVRLRYGGPTADELLELSDGPSDDPPAAVLANSSLAAPALLDVDPSTPAAIYVHEEGDGLTGLPEDAKQGLCERADLVITVSDRSRADLIALGVRPERITLLPPVIEIGRPPSAIAVAAIRRKMTGGEDVPLIVGCGEVSWRKGADLFPPVVAAVRRKRPVRAAWIGRRFSAEQRLLDRDTDALGLTDSLLWIGEVARPLGHLAAADILLMTSREDPRPMVPMEAALVGTPTVGFAVGGVADLAEEGAALTAPYPDVGALAERICELLDDDRLATSLVERAVERVTTQQAIDVVGPRFVEIIRALMETDVDTVRRAVQTDEETTP